MWHLKDHIDRFFIRLFQPENLANWKSIDGNFQIKQYDAFENLPDLKDPSAAADVILSENSDYLLGWGILRRMMRDDVYRGSVLVEIEKKKHEPI